EGMEAEPQPLTDIDGARVLAKLGDSVTTDHISPAGSIKKDGPAGAYLIEHGVQPREFNSYGARRGNHEVMMRGTFANIRLRNQLAPGTEGGVTRYLGDGSDEEMSIYDAAMRYAAEGTPLVVLGGKEYGSGSSRDWAAKGTNLLGVRAVIAESFERIHRSNLVGMGVVPLQYPEGENAESLGLTGESGRRRLKARAGAPDCHGVDWHAPGLIAPANPTPDPRFVTDVILDLGLAAPDDVQAAVEAARTSGGRPETMLVRTGALDD